MGSIVAVLGGVMVMCSAGFGVSTALKWFHTYEVSAPTAGKVKERNTGSDRESPHSERLNNLSKKIRS